MVIGFIQRMSHLYIETVKLTDLSRNDIMEFMWEVEVKDMMNLDNLKKGS